MRTFLTFVLLFNFVWVCNSQTASKSVFIQDFNNNVIKNIVLKIKPANTNNKFMGYTLFIYVSNSEVVEISRLESSFSGDNLPVDEDIQLNFIESLAGLDLTPYKGCLLVYPVLFKMNSSHRLEENFSEGIKSMMPLIKFENVDCIQFQEPIIVSGKSGV